MYEAFNKDVEQLCSELRKAKDNGVEQLMTRDGRSYVDDKTEFYAKPILQLMERIKKQSYSLNRILDYSSKNRKNIPKLLNLIINMDYHKNLLELVHIADAIKELSFDDGKSEDSSILKLPEFPQEVKADIAANIDELQQTMGANLYRASVVLCERILKIALERKYFELARKDVVEENYSITRLAKEIESLGVDLSGELKAHLNNVQKINHTSVSVGHGVFYPNSEQAKHLTIRTIETLRDLFS